MGLFVSVCPLQALMSLFVLASKDGWVNIMYHGLDAVGIDQQVINIDCIQEMDVTSVTSPIGLWTAARKPMVSNLGSVILKISGACWEK